MKRQAKSLDVPNRAGRSLVAIACAVLLVPGESILFAQTPPSAAPAGTAEADDPPLTADQLDSLVAPIALYPDDLLAQVLASSTYPLELMQLQQWMAKHKDLKDKALADAVAKQPWDPSVQSMAAVPEALKRVTDDIQWTTDLGNAFLDQQKDVMDACQRMRKKAKDKGSLTSNEQMKVETKVVETKEVIVVQSANPEVIYVPSYNPTVVYPPPVYPYPPVYYPPYVPGAAFVSFGVGMMVGAAFWGGSCCGCGWGGGNVNVNVNNNFNRNTNINGGNRGQGGGNWNHNASHRGGTPYGNNKTASKYGGSSRGQQGGRGTSASNRASGGAGSRGGPSAGTSDRSGGGGNRGGPSAGTSDRSGGGGSRGVGGASASDRSSGGGRGGDSVGSRDVGGGGGSRGGSSGFSGGSGGFSGSSARSSSSRGSSSMGSRGGGGGGRGGGGGGRGGGGRR